MNYTRTLILNQGYLPHEIVGWREAVTRMFNAKLEVIAQYDEVLTVIGRNHLATFPELARALRQVIGTDAESITIKVPAVAVLRRKVRMVKTGIKFSKVNVCLRDNFSCFGAGTRVLMSNGEQKPIENIRVGDRVIDAFGAPRTVLATGSRIAGDVGRLKAGRSFEDTLVTPEHPFLTPSGDFLSVGDLPSHLVFPRQVHYEPNPHRTLLATDFLPEDKSFGLKGGRVYWARRFSDAGFPVAVETSPDLAYTLGLYCAEGSSDMTARWSFSMGERHTLAPSVVRFLNTLGLNPSVDEYPEKDTCIVRASSKVLGLLLRGWCGRYSDGKVTPWAAIGPYHEAYLKGLFRGDAYIRQDKIVLTLTSEDLIRGAEAMLWGLGVYPSAQFVAREGKKPSWSLVLQGENFSRFSKLLGGDPKAGKRIYGDKQFIFRKLQKFELTGLSLMVYNLEVEGSNSYIANGFSVHNCQYCGVKLPMSQLEYEHVVPRVQGGKTVWDNIVMACTDCNSRKAGRTPEQAGMTLLSIPRKPKTLPMHAPFLDADNIPSEWAPFVTAA